MMKRTVTYLLVLLSVMMAGGRLSAQEKTATAAERIQVCTDRTMYISGERIFFSAVVYNPADPSKEAISRIFYGELVTPDGNRIAGGKYLLEHSRGEGCLTIPEETISGIYYIRFYTRFMRNEGPGHYKFIMLKIVNPVKSEVLASKSETRAPVQPAHSGKGDTLLQIPSMLPDQKIYAPREVVRVAIPQDVSVTASGKMCLSVIPAGSCREIPCTINAETGPGSREFSFPETRGITLSGQIKDKASGKPVIEANINLSVIGDRDIQVVRSDSSGRFFFALPDYTGSRDIFLCAEDTPENRCEILINNDFSPGAVSLSAPPFSLDDAEAITAYRMAVNHRISSSYGTDSSAVEIPVKKSLTPFYDVPSEVIRIDKYIELPTLEEYFTELPVIVKVRKSKGKKQFRFTTPNAELSLYDPLILVDWVAVTDITKILAMPPRDIDRVELVDAIYFKGKIIYGGIISFISKKNDFAGIDLPTSGTFINYKFREECTRQNPEASLPSNIPDARNTIYWNPDIKPGNGTSSGITFPAPDTPGKYILLLREMGGDGEIRTKTELFEVTGG